MTEQSVGLRTATFLLFLFSAVVLWGYSQKKEQLTIPEFALQTSSDRRDTLDAFKTAWAARPSEPTPDHARSEKDFINRTATFVDRVSHREIRTEAYAFYQRTVFDFFDRYGSEDILGQR